MILHVTVFICFVSIFFWCYSWTIRKIFVSLSFFLIITLCWIRLYSFLCVAYLNVMAFPRRLAGCSWGRRRPRNKLGQLFQLCHQASSSLLMCGTQNTNPLALISKPKQGFLPLRLCSPELLSYQGGSFPFRWMTLLLCYFLGSDSFEPQIHPTSSCDLNCPVLLAFSTHRLLAVFSSVWDALCLERDIGWIFWSSPRVCLTRALFDLFAMWHDSFCSHL